MKILIIHCIYQFKGGEETVVEEEAKLLRNAGHTVQLLSFSNTGNTVAKLLQAPFNFSSYHKTRKAIRRFAPDVVHIHNLHFAASPSVLYAVKHSGVSSVSTLHNYRLLCPSAMLFHKGEAFLHSLDGSFPWKAVKNGVAEDSTLLTFWLAFCTQFHYWLGSWKIPGRYIVLSAHAKKIFLQAKRNFAEEQFVIKPNFCSAPTQMQPQREEAFLFVGRLSKEKGIRFLLKAFASSPFKITIAGDGPLKEEVIAFTRMHNNISYAGSLQKDALLQLMKRSTALVFPSIWYEGMPLTIIEAFACGLPVIASRIGAMEHMITPGYNGLLFEVGNEAALKLSLQQWTAMPAKEKAAYSGNAGHTYEQHYTPERNVEQLLAIYRSVQKKQPQTALALAG